jgi:hypothetical protein
MVDMVDNEMSQIVRQKLHRAVPSTIRRNQKGGA